MILGESYQIPGHYGSMEMRISKDVVQNPIKAKNQIRKERISCKIIIQQ